MNSLYIIATTLACAGVGGFIGERLSRPTSYNDFGIGSLIGFGTGIAGGGLVGVIAGSILFA